MVFLGQIQILVPAPQINLQEQLSQQERAVKLATELRDASYERALQLENQLKAMDQQIRAAKQQVVLARDQVAAEQDRTNAQKANMSLLTKEQQTTAASILKRFNETKHLSRQDALTLQKLGISQGAIGRGINATLAEGVDPELAKQFKAAGGEESLDKAQQHLKDSTEDLTAAQNDAIDATDEFTDVFDALATWAAEVTQGQKNVEATRASMQETKDPNAEPEGKKGRKPGKAAPSVVSELHRAREEFVAALNEIGMSAVSAIRESKAESRRVAQRIKQAQIA